MDEKYSKQKGAPGLMKVLLTGANGMLGHDMAKLFESKGFKVILTDIHNLDITDKNVVINKIFKEQPDIVIHGAAYTNVDGAETDKETAFMVNGAGTENLAIATAQNDIPIVYISTDYVFDGTKKSPYQPEDKVAPINVYGDSKLAGEAAVQKHNSKHYICRTSWLYGHHGKNFVETMIQLGSSRDELKVVADQVGCPTWTFDLAKAVLHLIENKMEYGIYHTCGGGSTSWYGFAKKIFELEKIKVNLMPCNTEEFPRPANRPRYSIMNNNNLCQDWEKALEGYLSLRKEVITT